jgi:hypothetical protein
MTSDNQTATKMTPEQEGYAAWGCGIRFADNPFRNSSHESAKEWDNGWLEAETVCMSGTNDMTETAICPHCGEETEQSFMLEKFTCGNCDRSFARTIHEFGIVTPEAWAALLKWRSVTNAG